MADLTRKTANLLNIADCNFTINSTLSVAFAKGVITLNGTSGYISSSNAAWKSNFAFYLDAGTYSMNIPTQLGTGYARYIKQYSDDTTLLGASATSFTLAERTQVYFSFYIDSKTLDDTMNFMLVEGSTVQDFEPYGWVHSLRKQCSASEIIQSGDTIYADGQPITTYTLKGNEEHTGTPSPQNPVMPQGTGNKTANLLPTNITWYLNNNASAMDKSDVSDIRIKTDVFPVSDTNAYLTVGGFNLPNIDGLYLAAMRFYGDDLTTPLTTSGSGNTRAIPTGAKWASLLYGTNSTTFDTSTIKSQMQAAQITAIYGQTAPTSYIPYGYKIPISSGGVTTNIYLGSVQTVRAIKKLVLTGEETVAGSAVTGGWIITNLSDSINNTAGVQTAYCSHYEAKENGAMSGLSNGEMCISTQYNNRINFVTSFSSATDFQAYLAQQYANGTPVTVWYVLATATTGVVNEPLMKIGTYADTLSNAAQIPTTDGANTITVDTTVQPSEFTATWTGWHDSSVKEWDGSDWQ